MTASVDTGARPHVDRHGQVVLLAVVVGLLGGRFSLDRISADLPPWDLRWPGVLVVLSVYFLWRAAGRQLGPARLFPGPGLLLFVVWAGWMAFSSMWAQPDARVGGIVADLLLMSLLVTLAADVMGRLGRSALHAVWMWFVAAGLVYFASAVSTGPGLQDRYAALGGGPNVFVRIMVLACLGAFFLASVRESRRILWTVPVFCVGAVLSGSRGGLAAFLVVALIGAIPQWRRMPRVGRRTVTAVAVCAALASPFALGPQLVESLRGRFVVQTLHEQYDSSRWEIAEAAFHLFETYPLLGAGLDGYHALAGGGASFEYPHNLVLATGAEGGIVGLALLVLAVGCFIRTVLLGRPLTTEALYAMLAALYILIASMFSGDYYDSRFAWFFLGLAAVEARRGAGRTAPTAGSLDSRQTAGGRPPTSPAVRP
jgi:O-antigen ligase